jgi:hypothetical protein
LDYNMSLGARELERVYRIGYCAFVNLTQIRPNRRCYSGK